MEIGEGERLIEEPTFSFVNGNKVWNYDGLVVAYKANSSVEFCDRDGFTGEFADKEEVPKWKSPIYMPRWASRILLEITGIRIERLQDITWKDAEKEGVMFNDDEDLWFNYQSEIWDCIDPIESYQSLINKINGPKTWDENPWVWVVEFRVIEVKGVRDGSYSF